MICIDCKAETEITRNGRCPPCAEKTNLAWQARMRVRQDAGRFNCQKLINLLLQSHWMHECEIISNYNDTKYCVVRYTYKSGEQTFLRYSNGPLQGYFWDIYGDDMNSIELALLALSNAPPPHRIDVVIPTHGR